MNEIEMSHLAVFWIDKQRYPMRERFSQRILSHLIFIKLSKPNWKLKIKKQNFKK